MVLYSPREIQAHFKASCYRLTRQQFLDHTEKLVNPIPFSEPSLLYVKRHKLPIQDIHKDPTKESKARQTQQKSQKIQNNPTAVPISQFFPCQGGVTPSYQSSSSPSQPKQGPISSHRRRTSSKNDGTHQDGPSRP